MSSTYEQAPGRLNLSFNRGNDFSALVDFSISMTGYQVAASIASLVSGAEIVQFTTVLSDAAAGKVNISLTDTQTAAIPRGTYAWSLIWTENNATRTALTGFVML